jgi:hypothetical protein
MVMKAKEHGAQSSIGHVFADERHPFTNPRDFIVFLRIIGD